MYSEFLAKHIKSELQKHGYSIITIEQSVDKALAHYRSHSATKKGSLFDDCLHIAKAWANKYHGKRR